MATMLDRLLKLGLSERDVSIPVHSFAGTLFGLSRDGRGTRADMIQWFSISLAEEPELDGIIALVVGSREDQVEILMRVWSTLLIGEEGTIDKTEVKTRLGLTLG